jgi:amidohydrolase
MEQGLQIEEIYQILHGMPEVAFEEYKTALFLAGRLEAAGFEVETGLGGTGVVGVMRGEKHGPVVALKADMDALLHVVDGREVAVHSCGHDGHCAIVLAVAETMAARKLAYGDLKIIFQPAEEPGTGALRLIDAGVADDIEVLLGIHLRPMQEAKLGQATSAVLHGAHHILEAKLIGKTAHGARPHLGINAIEAAVMAVNAVLAIHMNPVIPASIKVTKLHGGGASLNSIPDLVEMAFDLRSQENALMKELVQKARCSIETAASMMGATAVLDLDLGVPAAEYSDEIVELARKAIQKTLGAQGLIAAITTPGGDDFHFYKQKKPNIKTGFIGLGCDLQQGLHHPEMSFNRNALRDGYNILLHMMENLLGETHREIVSEIRQD